MSQERSSIAGDGQSCLTQITSKVSGYNLQIPLSHNVTKPEADGRFDLAFDLQRNNAFLAVAMCPAASAANHPRRPGIEPPSSVGRRRTVRLVIEQRAETSKALQLLCLRVQHVLGDDDGPAQPAPSGGHGRRPARPRAALQRARDAARGTQLGQRRAGGAG